MNAHAESLFALFRQHLAKSGALELATDGGCMRPTMIDATRIRVADCEADALEVGDVVCFRRGAHYFAHRLLAKVPGGGATLLTKGDLSLLPDRLIATDAVLGRVSHFQRDGRWIPLDSGWRRRFKRVLAGASPFAPLLVVPFRIARRFRRRA